MFQDEARFGRINSPQSCWAPPGVRPLVPCHMVQEYTYAYAAVSPSDGVLDSLVLPVVNAHAMSLFLSRCLSVTPMSSSSWLWTKPDGTAPRTSRFPKICGSFSCHPTVRNSIPQHLWEEIREKWFPNQVFNSLNGVESVLVDALDSLTIPGKVASITGFDWVINLILNYGIIVDLLFSVDKLNNHALP